MKTDPILQRYSVIREKNPREIVMLRGSGCRWRRCRFCDYHTDFSKDDAENYRLNRSVLTKVTGEYHTLEVINSGSFTDLDEATITLIKQTCLEKEISRLHFECHWMHRRAIPQFKEDFARLGIAVKIKMGVETFHALFRESYLDKGMGDTSAQEIARYADEVCLLQGIPGQTVESMRGDIEIGLAYFERVCVNIMQKNTRPILPDPSVISLFMQELYPQYRENPRVDILLQNTDFGVGGAADAE